MGHSIRRQQYVQFSANERMRRWKTSLRSFSVWKSVESVQMHSAAVLIVLPATMMLINNIQKHRGWCWMQKTSIEAQSPCRAEEWCSSRWFGAEWVQDENASFPPCRVHTALLLLLVSLHRHLSSSANSAAIIWMDICLHLPKTCAPRWTRPKDPQKI